MTRIRTFRSTDFTTFTGHNEYQENFAGNFGFVFDKRSVDYILLKLSADEEQTLPIRNREKNENVRFFRITSDKMKLTGIQPYVKINLDRNLVYFLTERSSNGQISEPEFETRGIKVRYLNIDVEYLNN